MTNSLDLKFTAKLYDGANNTAVRDILQATRESVTERSIQRFSLPDLITDQQVNFDSVDGANLLIIRADQEITVKVGGTEAARAIALTPTLDRDSGGTDWAFFAITASAATLVYLTNSSGSAANIEVFLI